MDTVLGMANAQQNQSVLDLFCVALKEGMLDLD